MNPCSLDKSLAVAVLPVGTEPINIGDIILLSVKCEVTESGDIRPVNHKITDAVNSILSEHGNEVFFAKRVKVEKNENDKPAIG